MKVETGKQYIYIYIYIYINFLLIWISIIFADTYYVEIDF